MQISLLLQVFVYADLLLTSISVRNNKGMTRNTILKHFSCNSDSSARLTCMLHIDIKLTFCQQMLEKSIQLSSMCYVPKCTYVV